MGEDPLGDVWRNPLVKKEFQLQLPSGTQSMFLLSLWGGAKKIKSIKTPPVAAIVILAKSCKVVHIFCC